MVILVQFPRFIILDVLYNIVYRNALACCSLVKVTDTFRALGALYGVPDKPAMSFFNLGFPLLWWCTADVGEEDDEGDLVSSFASPPPGLPC